MSNSNHEILLPLLVLERQVFQERLMRGAAPCCSLDTCGIKPNFLNVYFDEKLAKLTLNLINYFIETGSIKAKSDFNFLREISNFVYVLSLKNITVAINL